MPEATIARHCPQCRQYAEIKIQEGAELACPRCRDAWGRVEAVSRVFDSCPICACKQFYLSKDFNQVLGCLILSIGIVLVPWTYGLSLPVFALLDWFLHQRVPTIVNCYKCGSEFRNLPDAKDRSLKPFQHHIGLKYDKYR